MEFEVYLLALGLRNLLWENDDQDKTISEMLLLILNSMKSDVPTPCKKM